MLGALFVGVALAAEPTVTMLDDGTIVGSVVVRAPADVARKKVADPAWVSAVEGGGTTTKVVGREGDCVLLESSSPSAIVTAQYATRQCPTALGVKSTLRSSNTFSDYGTEWRVVPDGAGSRLEYRLWMKLKIYLPQSFVSGTLKKRVTGMLEKVGAALGT